MAETYTRRRITVDELHAELRAQGVPREHVAFVCPMCETVQSIATLIAAGAGVNAVDVERYVGFSCVGRFTGQPGPSKAQKGKGCDWTLGGLFGLHTLEVETPDGQVHPSFAPATPAEAQELMAAAMATS